MSSDAVRSTGGSPCAGDDVKVVLRRVGALRLDTLPPATLLAMEARLVDQQRALHDRTLELERRLQESLASGDGVLFGEWRRTIRLLGRENDDIEEQIERVRNAYQHRVLDDRMAVLLRGRHNVEALEGVVLILIFVVLALLLYEMLTPDLPVDVLRAFFLVDTACCAIFLTEFGLRHRCADSKRWFWRHHWIDFVTSIPMPDAFLLRAGRLARVARATRVTRAVRMARLLRVVRGLRVLLFFWRGFDRLYEVVNVRLMKKSLALALTFLVLGAAAIFVAEGKSDNGAAVDTPIEAAWWSFTTVVTGGFGDIYNPASGFGRVTTVVLVIAGMTVVGVFTATLTSILVGDESRAIEAMQHDIVDRLDTLDRRVVDLGGRIEAVESDPPRGEGAR